MFKIIKTKQVIKNKKTALACALPLLISNFHNLKRIPLLTPSPRQKEITLKRHYHVKNNLSKNKSRLQTAPLSAACGIKLLAKCKVGARNASPRRNKI